MPRERKDAGKAGHGVEHSGQGLGGGPVGSGGSYNGRPGGNNPRPQQPRPQQPNQPQQPRPQQPGGQPQAQRTVGGRSVNGGGGLILALLAWLFLGNKNNGGSTSTSGSYGGGASAAGGLNLGKIIRIIIIAAIIIFLLKSCSGSNSNSYTYNDLPSSYDTVQSSSSSSSSQSSSNAYSYDTEPAQQSQSSSSNTVNASNQGSYSYSSWPFNYSNINSGTTSSGWTYGDNRGKLNTQVADGARNKFYTPKSGDSVTVMVYMIATDLESNYGMATADLQEMINGLRNMPDNMNFIVYGGGCTGWQNRQFSNSSNICYRLTPNGLQKLYDDGDKVMTDPNTLASFIGYCGRNYPANRNILVFWDHGGGSVSGYGYDQRHKSSGSMDLAGIYQALSAGGVRFDVIGFDACLMATYETALTTANFADYLVASEESEPGIGWFHTGWVQKLCQNTSVSTLELGKQIADDFVSHCASEARGQDATLSLVDLSEFQKTAPKAIDAFATSTTDLINNNEYSTVAKARSGAKEYAASSKIDQVDLTDLAGNIGTAEAQELAKCILSAVKYNNTSNTISDSYGMSAYFPYRSLSTVNTAVKTFNKLNLNANFSRCIESFASMAASGQNASGGYYSPFGSLSGYGSSSYSSGSSYSGYGDILSLMQEMMYGRSLNVKGLETAGDMEFMQFVSSGISNGLDLKAAAQYIADNQFDPSQLTWQQGSDGTYYIDMPEDQWALVQSVEQSLFVDDGAGFVDLGIDITTDMFTSDGKLVGEAQDIWLGVEAQGDGWTCAYYLMSDYTDDEGNSVIKGYIPVLYNGERARLIVTFFNSEVESIAVQRDYTKDADASSQAAKIADLQEGDEIVLIADYYDYDNNYQDNYQISKTLVYDDTFSIVDLELQDPASANACYRITDIYNQTYWTDVLK